MFNNLGYDADLVFRNHPEPPGLLSRLLGLKGDLPKIFIAGAQKSGTTSLFAALVGHPSIVRPKKKESFFFGNDILFAKGISFYRSYFRKTGAGQQSMDASTNYFDHPKAAERIRQAVPDAKVILILRDPVARAYSHYRMQVKNKIEQLSFEDALEKENERIAEGKKILPVHNYCYQRLGYRSRGEYSRMLPSWMNTFDEKRLLVLVAENYFANPQNEYRRILEFLELPEYSPEKFEIFNAGPGGEISEQARQQLRKHYVPYNAQLESLLNVKLNWNEA